MVIEVVVEDGGHYKRSFVVEMAEVLSSVAFFAGD